MIRKIFSNPALRLLKLEGIMVELTDRQKLILTLVIHEYTRTAVPVGSDTLVERCHLDMSSATVRNEMKVLTENGFLRKPHDQAGRVPTEDGYRYFVGSLLEHTDLPVPTRRTISHQFFQMHDIEQWMRLTASILAKQSRAASLVTAPHPKQSRLKHVELISTRGRQVLMVVVMVGGEIRQRIFSLSEPGSQEQLSITADRLTRLYQNQEASGLFAEALPDPLDREILGYVRQEMIQAQDIISSEIYLDGITNVLSEPEFSASDQARRALRVLEDSAFLKDLLSRTAMTGEIGGVQVLIGGEGNWEDLRQFSVVVANYGTPGQTTGTLGVLGPMRMPYGRTISTVRFLAGLLSDLVTETLSEDEE